MTRDYLPGLNRLCRVGRPRRGTELARTDTLLAAATQVFLRDGYGFASMDKVASEAGVSTRTIYERFKNKADLLDAVITRLVNREMAPALAPDELDHLEPRQALNTVGQVITGLVCNPESAAMFRIVATESHRFPELARKMRCGAKARVDDALARYLRAQVHAGALTLANPDCAARLFAQMICARLHEGLLFGPESTMTTLDRTAHIGYVVEIFLNGALPRDASPTTSPLL